MKKIRVSAKNVQKAIEEGLKELKATQEEVDIKIIDEGGLFKKATVELTLDKEVEEQRQKELEEENKKLNNLSKENNEDKSSQNKKIETKIEEKCEDKKSLVSSKSDESSNKENKKVNEENLETSYVVTGKDEIELGTNFLKGLFNKMGVEAEITAVSQEGGVTFNASGEKVSTLIGKRGETLNAIQDILSNVLKNNGYRETRFYFDVENYKNRREISLVNLAERMASKALKIKKPIKLEKMSAYERKIIHSALQNFEGVSTHSEGEEPNRYLIIIPTKEEE